MGPDITEKMMVYSFGEKFMMTGKGFLKKHVQSIVTVLIKYLNVF